MRFSKINKTYIVLFILLIGSAFRLLFIKFPYWGMEYEDSYIFSATARILNKSYDFSYDLFYTKYISFGSTNEILKMTTISGHFIFFPVLLAGIDKLITYSPYNVLYVNAIISLLGIFFLLKTYILINGNRGLLIFGLLISSIPILSVYNTTGLSETFSSLFISLTLYIGFKATKRNFTKWIDCCVYIIIVSISIFIKRDNLVLLILPFFQLIHAIIKRDRILTKRIIILNIIILLIVFSSNFIFNIERTIMDETSDIGRNPFGFDIFIQIVPTFIKALFDFRHFSIVGIIIIVAVYLAIKKRDTTLMPLLLIFLSFLIIYSSHYRSYYMIHEGFRLSAFDTFRYYTNFIAVIVLYSISIIVKHLGAMIEKKVLRMLICVVVALIVNMYYNFTLREMYSEEEYGLRFYPVIKTLSLIKENDIVITDLPIMFQMLAPKGLTIIDLSMMGENEISYVNKKIKTSHIYSMTENKIDKRYKKKEILFEQFNLTKISAISENYTIYKVGKRS